MAISIDRREKYHQKLELASKDFNEVLKVEVNSSLVWKDEQTLTKWLEIKINSAIRNYITVNEKDRVKIHIDKKVDWIFNKRKYNLVLEDTKTKKILCVINIQKVFYNINNNFYNLFKDTLLNICSLDEKNIPVYTIILMPYQGFVKNSNWQLWKKEKILDQNIYRIYNINNYNNKGTFTKLILLENEITNSEITWNVKVLDDLNDIILYKSNNIEAKTKFENKILIKQINNIYSDIYKILIKSVSNK